MQSKEAKAFDLSLEPAAVADGLRQQQVRRGLPAGPPAGRSRRHLRRGDAGRLGHAPEQLRPRQAAVAAGRSGHVGAGHRPEGARPARQHAGRSGWASSAARRSINQRGAKPGRDHYPRAWSTRHDRRRHQGRPGHRQDRQEGATVVERPISALDFMATVCQILGIDHNKQNNTPIGRPIRIVDKGANADQGVVRSGIGCRW